MIELLRFKAVLIGAGIHSPAFKVRVALAAIRGDRTLVELTEHFDTSISIMKILPQTIPEASQNSPNLGQAFIFHRYDLCDSYN